MRSAIGVLSAALLLTGCMHHKPAPGPAEPAPPVMSQPPPSAVIKPDLQATGRVAMVNAEARFVVISYPPGSALPTDQRLNVYRNGEKVGEIKVTGPQHENNTVADIVSGDVQLHDEVRAE
jgi:hypothetical protein